MLKHALSACDVPAECAASMPLCKKKAIRAMRDNIKEVGDAGAVDVRVLGPDETFRDAVLGVLTALAGGLPGSVGIPSSRLGTLGISGTSVTLRRILRCYLEREERVEIVSANIVLDEYDFILSHCLDGLGSTDDA